MKTEKMDINAVCFGILCNFTPVCGEERAKEAVALIRSLQAQLEQAKQALAMMWFAYENKDAEFPHEFEIEALQTAQEILGPWKECIPKYLRRGAKEG